MASYDFNAQRLFVPSDLAAGAVIACTPDAANYLRNVMRLTAGDGILVFNGRDGEWQARLAEVSKRAVTLAVGERTRAQTSVPDVDYLFAPLKRARLDYMVQKATEMGVRRLRPVITQHTVAERVNLERMRANAIEAAEQCGILSVPDVSEPEKFARVIEGWDASRRLIVCDEDAPVSSPLAALRDLPPGPLAVLIGPEGGFSSAERESLRSKPWCLAISLGPRILRADTAAVAALTLVHAVSGDWR